MGFPEGLVGQILGKIGNILNIERQDSYEVFFLWPERFASNPGTKFKHWPTREQVRRLNRRFRSKADVQQFAGMCWKSGTAICNRVATTKMPYYSRDWSHDTPQDHVGMESKVLSERDIFQVPIPKSGVVMAIFGINTLRLDIDLQLEIYEEALKHTSDLYTCVVNDISRACQLEVLLSIPIINLTHEFRTEFLEYVKSKLQGFAEQGAKEKNGTIKIPDKDIRDMLFVLDHNIQMRKVYADYSGGFLGSKKANSSRIIPSREVLNLDELIEKAQFLVECTGLGLPPCRYEKTNIEFYGDRTLLLVVLFNLIYNARKYTKPSEENGGFLANKSVFIRARTNKNRVIIQVEDEGVGMSPEVRERCFEYGFKGEDSDGVGIGLSISRSIIRAHGGDIPPPQSTLGKGSKFTIIIRKN